VNSYWAVKFDGKRMHIEYATRLPRKRKKLIKHIFDCIGPKSVGFVCISPTLNEVLGSWAKTKTAKDTDN
jgi:hypothetical protein